MKKLKVYEKPELELLDASLGFDICNKPFTASSYGNSNIEVDESEDADEGNQAAIFRPGIWDEE